MAAERDRGGKGEERKKRGRARVELALADIRLWPAADWLCHVTCGGS